VIASQDHHAVRTCFRKVNAERNIADEPASISRSYDTAQRLFKRGKLVAPNLQTL
jgi:hypothetical protein